MLLPVTTKEVSPATSELMARGVVVDGDRVTMLLVVNADAIQGAAKSKRVVRRFIVLQCCCC